MLNHGFRIQGMVVGKQAVAMPIGLHIRIRIIEGCPKIKLFSEYRDMPADKFIRLPQPCETSTIFGWKVSNIAIKQLKNSLTSITCNVMEIALP
jgi:hypothetical protein